MSGRQILETERLLIREFYETDAAAFFRLGSDPNIIRYTGDPGGGLTNVEQALDVLRSRPMTDYAKYGYGRWACICKEDGKLIGFSGLKYLDDLREVDLGYRFLPEYWGRGLATESGRAVVDYGFTHLALDHIIGLVVPDHRASCRVLEKLGFRFAEVINYRGEDVARYLLRTTKM